MRGRLLLVDGDVERAATLQEALTRRGHDCDTVRAGAGALAVLARREHAMVIADVDLAPMSAAELCQSVRAAYPTVVTVLLTPDAGIESAHAALAAGAHDFVARAVVPDLLFLAIDRAAAHAALVRELGELRTATEVPSANATIVGDSLAMRRVLEIVDRIADSDATILLVGESGTGKETVARAIHARSRRRHRPFVVLNCAAVPAAQLESALFGHVRDAFPDAVRSRPGVFVQAAGGTVFLDEIGALPSELQLRLLHTLQEHRVRPMGDAGEVGFDARVITATNRNLETDVVGGQFRDDLYYAINVLQLSLPPLRARSGDLLLLAHHFLRQIAQRRGKTVAGIGADAARVMADYDWPGNVRELEHCLEHAVALTAGSELGTGDLPVRVRDHRSVDPATGSALLPLSEVERRYIRQVLATVGGNQTLAARILQIDRRSLARRLGTAPDDSAAAEP